MSREKQWRNLWEKKGERKKEKIKGTANIVNSRESEMGECGGLSMRGESRVPG